MTAEQREALARVAGIVIGIYYAADKNLASAANEALEILENLLDKENNDD